MKFRKLAGVIILAASAALTGAPAIAQQPPRPAAPAPAAPAQQKPVDEIPIPNATPAHLAAARELVIKSGLSKSFDGAIPNMMRQLNATVTRTRPELTNEMKATLDRLQPEFMKLTEDMIVNATRIYTALMNEQECKDTLTFFNSPIGTKFVALQPIIFANISDVMEPWTKHLSQVMYEMVRTELKKKNIDI
jgi:hypothetical protein